MTLARRRVLFVVAACLAVMTLAACGGADATGLLADRSLVGTWKGSTTAGDGGSDAITMSLKADSTMSLHADNRPLCRVTGVWTVSRTQFIARGSNCSGMAGRLVAPFSHTRLIGTLSISGGGSGTFDVAKQ